MANDADENPDFAAELAALKYRGLNFSDCIAAFGAQKEGLEQYRTAAYERYHDEGEVEIDDETVVSIDDTVSPEEVRGAYVMAWVWVPANVLP